MPTLRHSVRSMASRPKHVKKRPLISVNFVPRRGQGGNPNSSEPNLIQRFSPTPGSKPQDISFDRLRGRSKLTRSIARYVRVTNAKNAPSTRSNVLDNFRYFYEFLDSWEKLFGRKVASLDDIDQHVLDGYANWLDGEESVGSDLNIEGGTKNRRYNHIKRLLLWCQGGGQAAPPDGKPLRFHLPWPEKKYKPKPLKLSQVDISRVFKGCKILITETAERLEFGLSVVEDQRIAVPNLQGPSVIPFLDFRTKLKSAHAATKVNLLSGPFRQEMPGLARALRPKYGTVEEIIDHLHLTADTITPYLILIALPTCFNEVGLISLCWSNVQQREGLLGGRRIYLKAEKRRSGYPQHRSFSIDDDPFSVGRLLEQVKKFTALTHTLCFGEHDDVVFLPFRRRGGGPRPLWNGNYVDTAVARALDKFRKRFDLPPFTLNDLRTIGGDIASEMSRGDLIVQQIVQQQKTPATTDKHYTTDKRFWERREGLAHTMNERERIISSRGKVDTRNQGGRTRLYSAATPGFDCDNPHDSPIPGQRKGTLCTAYGKCFACPLSSVTPSVRSAARLLQFKAEFHNACQKMNSARWIVEWHDQERALHDFWLPQFHADLLAAADVRSVPPIVPIE